MNSSKMLLLSTIAIIGSFSIIKTKEFTPAEKSLIQAVDNTIEFCDTNDEAFHNNNRQTEQLGLELTPAQLRPIFSDKLNKLNDKLNNIQENQEVNCENCKQLAEGFKMVLEGMDVEISEGRGDLTIRQIMAESLKDSK